MQRTVSESSNRTSISEEMVSVIAKNAGYPERISVEASAYSNGKFSGLLLIHNGKTSGELPTVLTNAVFKTAEAAVAHMRSLVEQVREAAVLGGHPRPVNAITTAVHF